jgi:hypothetical protein
MFAHFNPSAPIGTSPGCLEKQCPSEKIGVFQAISSIFDVDLTPTGGLAAAVSTEK